MKFLGLALLLVAFVAGLLLGWGWLETNIARVAAGVERLRKRLLASRAVQRFRAHYPKLARFFAARFERGEYLGLHLTVGFVFVLAGLVAFAAITTNVVEQTAITQTDMTVYEWLHAHATLPGYGGWSVISSLGSGLALAILGAGVALLLVLRRRWVVLGGWAAAILGSALLDGAFKVAIRRPRPAAALDFLSHASWSFPSGHSMSSLVTYGMLAYLFTLTIKGRKPLQIGVMLAALLLILAIGFSRMYLGVHYFSDVLGGFAGGALWLSACVSSLEVARRLKGRAPVTP
jgi:membrane-associated phospholipid phosphatase